MPLQSRLYYNDNQPRTAPPSLVVREIIVSAGVGSRVQGEDWQTFAVSLPDDRVMLSDNLIGISDTGVIDSDRVLISGGWMLNPQVDILVRGIQHENTRQKVLQVMNFIDTLRDVYVTLTDEIAEYAKSMYNIKNANRLNPLAYNGFDERLRRHTWGMSYELKFE